MEGLIFGGAYLPREICVSKSIGLALQLEGNLPFLLCFTLYLRAIFQVQAPGGLIFGGAIQRRVFCVTGLGSLYLEGLIHGGVYFRNFKVYYLIRDLEDSNLADNLHTSYYKLCFILYFFLHCILSVC